MKVLTLNLNYYGTKHGEWKDRKKLVANIIAENKPDLIAFQAVACDSQIGNGEDQGTQLANLFEEYSHKVFEPAEVLPGGRAEGSAILSRHSIKDLRTLKLSLRPDLEDRSHRILLHARFELTSGSFHLFNAHFSWVAEQASDNITEALTFIGSIKDRAILVGDFNMTPDSPHLQRLLASGWTDIWKSIRGNEAGLTFEADAPAIRIDYALCNAALAPRVTDIQVLTAAADRSGVRLSDHFALLITIG